MCVFYMNSCRLPLTGKRILYTNSIPRESRTKEETDSEIVSAALTSKELEEFLLANTSYLENDPFKVNAIVEDLQKDLSDFF